MLADQFTAAAQAARSTYVVDEVARLTWKAQVEGHLTFAEAEAVSEALQARRTTFATQRSPGPRMPVLKLPRPVQRSPDRRRSIERRRKQAMSGVVPAKVASAFTMGELAVLTVIGRQCQRGGACTLHIDAIAALAGVSGLLRSRLSPALPDTRPAFIGGFRVSGASFLRIANQSRECRIRLLRDSGNEGRVRVARFFKCLPASAYTHPTRADGRADYAPALVDELLEHGAKRDAPPIGDVGALTIGWFAEAA